MANITNINRSLLRSAEYIRHSLLDTQTHQRSFLHTTNILPQKRAGRYFPTPKRTRALTYDEANKPDMIGVTKSWLSLNTSNLLDCERSAETSHEDIFIRKFLHGTWPEMLASDVVIKRRGNQININFVALRKFNPNKFYFVLGYSEEILSLILKCVVKIDVQTIAQPEEMTYMYV